MGVAVPTNSTLRESIMREKAFSEDRILEKLEKQFSLQGFVSGAQIEEAVPDHDSRKKIRRILVRRKVPIRELPKQENR